MVWVDLYKECGYLLQRLHHFLDNDDSCLGSENKTYPAFKMEGTQIHYYSNSFRQM